MLLPVLFLAARLDERVRPPDGGARLLARARPKADAQALEKPTTPEDKARPSEAAGEPVGAVDDERPAQRRRQQRQLADVRPHLRRPALQPAQADQQEERQPPDPRVDVPDRRARRLRVYAAGHRRHHVHHDAVEPRLRHRLQDRLAALALPEVAAGEPGPVLRRRQPRLRRLGRSALHDHARRPPGLPRPQHRRGDLGHGDHRHRRRRQGDQATSTRWPTAPRWPRW